MFPAPRADSKVQQLCEEINASGKVIDRPSRRQPVYKMDTVLFMCELAQHTKKVMQILWYGYSRAVLSYIRRMRTLVC